MRILFKFIAKSIWEKKLRTLLIIFTVLISTSLFFASTTLPNTLEEMLIQNIRKYVGSSDIVVTAGEESPSPFFRWHGANRATTLFAIPSLESMALHEGESFELTPVKLLGIELKDLQSFNPYVLSQGNPDSLQEDEIIIPSSFGLKHNIELSDIITLNIFGEMHNLKIAGIGKSSGPFTDDGGMIQFVVSPKLIKNIYGLSNNYASTVYIASRTEDKDIVKTELRKLYSNLTVADSIPQSDIDYAINSIKMPFNIILGLVFFVSFFIIYTSFKLIVKERLPLTGSFRSLGATKAMTSFILMGEVLLYGIIGGFVGIFLGIGILKLASKLMLPEVIASSEFTMYSWVNIMLAYISAIFIVVISSMSPISNASKHSIKEIILNMMDKPRKAHKKYRPILGVLFMFFAALAPKYTPLSHLLLVVLLSLLLAITGVVFLVPTFTKLLVRLFEGLYQWIFGNVGVLACKNLRNNKNVIGSITLLALGITVLLTVNVITYSVMTEVGDHYRLLGNYDVFMSANRLTDEVVTEIRAMDNVTGVSPVLENFHVPIKDSDRKMLKLQGLTSEHLNYWKFDVDPKLIDRLSHGNYIVMARMALSNFGLEDGDTITILQNGNEHEFKIIGNFHCLSSNGDFGLISKDNFRNIYDIDRYTSLNIKTTDPEGLVRELREKYYHLNPYITTLEKMAQDNLDGNAAVFNILNAFSILAIICGVLGIINNLLISFIERKRSLAMYRSLGMSKSQILSMMLIESFTGGLAGGTLGILGAYVMAINIPHITKALAVTIQAHLKLSSFVLALLAGVLVMVLASISPAIKSSKLKIIEAIKYE